MTLTVAFQGERGAFSEAGARKLLGASIDVLPCKSFDINMTKLESRPIEGRPWEYQFYADISGDARERNVTNALNHLREMCETVVVLGSYVAA